MNKHWNESDHHFFTRAAEKAFDTLSISASSGKVGIAFQTVTKTRNGATAQSTTSTVHSFEITAAQLVTALGTTAVNRATADASGNTITSTYSTIAQTTLYGGDDTSLGAGSPADNIKTYFLNNAKMPPRAIKTIYNSAGSEYALLMAKSVSYGSILKWGYKDNYIYMLRHTNAWLSNDWEKISAGYADTAADSDKLDGYHASSFFMKGTFLDTHGEGERAVVIGSGNDLFAFYDRGGTCTAYELNTAYTEGSEIASNLLTAETLSNKTTITVNPLKENVFNGRLGYHQIAAADIYSGSNYVVYDLTLPGGISSYSYHNTFYWSFGSGSWKPKFMEILVASSNWNDKTYISKYRSTEVPYYGSFYLYQTGTNTSGGTTYGFDRIRIVMSKYTRLSMFGIENMSTVGVQSICMSKTNDDYVYRNITPGKNETYNIGASSFKWNAIYAKEFHGLADNAINDKDSNPIHTTYVKTVDVTPDSRYIAYTNLASKYSFGNTTGYYKIELPKTAVVWTMIQMEISLRHSYSVPYDNGGKVIINGYHNTTASGTWTNCNASIFGNILAKDVRIYIYKALATTDKDAIYITATAYGTISIDRLLTGDTATQMNLREVSITNVASVPETAIEITEKSAYGSKTFIKSSIGASGSSGNIVTYQHDMQFEIQNGTSKHALAMGVFDPETLSESVSPYGSTVSRAVIQAKAYGIGYDPLYLNPISAPVIVGSADPTAAASYKLYVGGQTYHADSIYFGAGKIKFSTSASYPNICGNENYLVMGISNNESSGSIVLSSGSLSRNANTSTLNLGSYDVPWTKIYGTTLYEGGTSLVSKYLTLSGGTLTGELTVPSLKISNAIKIGTSSIGSARRPVYINNGTITAVDSVAESILSWGGTNLANEVSPVDASLVPQLGANRTAFIPADAVTVEYSKDGGVTWTDYGASNASKINFFTGFGASFTIGRASSGSTETLATPKDMLRVTIDSLTGKLYTRLLKFIIYVSTNGTSNNWCTVQGRLQSNYAASTDTWSTFANKAELNGWSGYNVINISGLTTYGNNSTSHYRQVRFIFGCDVGSTNVNYAGLCVYGVQCIGGLGWQTPSTLANKGTVYDYDAFQNVYFPAVVQSLGDLKINMSKNEAKFVWDNNFYVNDYARHVFSIYNKGVLKSGIGIYCSGSGDAQTFNYLYIGSNAYDSASNLRIYTDKVTVGTNTILHAGNYSSYALPKAGGTMTGGIDLATAGGSQGMVMGAYTIGASGHVSGSTGNLINFTSLKDKGSFAGSIYPTYYNGESLAWQAIISVRHRNGAGDGASYGMYIRTNLTTDGSLVWNKQYGTNSYIGERTILDSANYKNHITDIPNITAPTTPVTAYESFTNKANVSSSKGTETNVKYVAIKGNTIVWNQNGSITASKWSATKCTITTNTSSISITPSGTYTTCFMKYSAFALTVGHKYYIAAQIKATTGATIKLGLFNTSLAARSGYCKAYTGTDEFIYTSLVTSAYTENSNYFPYFSLGVSGNGNVGEIKNFMCVDLTVMFGEGNEPDLATFTEWYPGYYPYNAGELVSFNGNIKSCGRNLWNEQWAYGDISGTTGEDVTSAAGCIYGESFIPVTPSTTLYISVINHSNIGGWIYHYDGNKNFISAYQTLYNKEIAIPENVYYIRIAPWLGDSKQYYPGPYKHDICVNVSDSSFNGTYEPYKELTIDLNIKNIKNSVGDVMFPDGLCSVGTAYDELSSKMAIKRIGKVDLGILTWVVYGAGGSAERITCSSFKNIGVPAADTSVSNIKCIKYTEETSVHVYEHSANNIIALSSSEGISIYDSTLVGKTAEEAKAALSGVYLYYELATPQYVYFDTPFNTSIPEINKGRTWISDNNETVKVPLKADVRKYSTTVQTAEKASYSDLSGFAYRAETAVKLAPGDILPDKDLHYNLGSTEYMWKRIYGGIYNGKSVNLSTAANWWRQYQWNNQMYLESMNSDGVASCMVAFNLADCNIGIGYNNPTGRVHIRREANRDYPILKVENTLASTTGYLNAIQALGPNVKNTTTLLLLGQSDSSYNSGYIGFHYSGTSGSTSANYLTLGIYAKDKVLNIFGNGCVAINSTTVANVNLYVNGTSAFTGDVTFGSTTSINFNHARYTTSSTEAFEPYSLAIGNGPWCRDFWHDHFAFRRYHTIVDQEVSADGTTWTADTRNINDLFIRKDNTYVELLTADERAFRFTLTGSNFSYSQILWFEVGSAWQSTPANVKVTIEYYSNDTWTVCSEGLISSLAAKFFKNSASFGVVPKIRFTFAKQDPYTGTFAAVFLRAYSSRKGGQGLGMEYEYPYTWDAYSNILPITDICSSLGSVSKRWLNVYASYMAVKKTGAENVLLEIMNNTGSVYLGKTASGRGYVGSKEAYTFEIWTNGNSRMTVASDGKIGINTTSPTHLLTVYGDSYVSGKMCVGTGGNNSYISSDSTTNIFLHTSSGAALVCDGAVVRPSYSLSSTSQLGSSSCPWAKAYITELHIGDATITWNATDQCIEVDKSFVAHGAVTAGE